MDLFKKVIQNIIEFICDRGRPLQDFWKVLQEIQKLSLPGKRKNYSPASIAWPHIGLKEVQETFVFFLKRHISYYDHQNRFPFHFQYIIAPSHCITTPAAVISIYFFFQHFFLFWLLIACWCLNFFMLSLW